MKFVVTYKNAGNTDKDPVVKEMVPTVLAGTPSILMSMNTTSNFMKPGETRRFTVKVLLTKMRCPIRFEVGRDSRFYFPRKVKHYLIINILDNLLLAINFRFCCSFIAIFAVKRLRISLPAQ